MGRAGGNLRDYDNDDGCEEHGDIHNVESLLSALALKAVKTQVRKVAAEPKTNQGKIAQVKEASILRRIAPRAKPIPPFEYKKPRRSLPTGILIFMVAVLLATAVVSFEAIWVDQNTSNEWKEHLDWDVWKDDIFGWMVVFVPLLEFAALLSALCYARICRKLFDFRILICRFSAYRKIRIQRGEPLPTPGQIRILKRFLALVRENVVAGLPTRDEQFDCLWAKADPSKSYFSDRSVVSNEQAQIHISICMHYCTNENFQAYLSGLQGQLLWNLPLSIEVRRRAQLRAAGTHSALYGLLLWFGPVTIAVIAWKLHSAVPHGQLIALSTFVLAFWAGVRRRRHYLTVRRELAKLDVLMGRLDRRASDFLGVQTSDDGEEPIRY